MSGPMEHAPRWLMILASEDLAHCQDITGRRRRLLALDLRGLVLEIEQAGDGNTHQEASHQAAHELAQRIGGGRNLSSYVDTLISGDDRRRNPPAPIFEVKS